MDYLKILYNCKEYEDETEWIEFKSNYVSPKDLGVYISAMSNSAAMLGKENAYMFFGLNDKTHKIEGTKFNFNSSVNGNEPLVHFIARQLSPSIAFFFDEFVCENERIVILVIPAAKIIPTSFDNTRYLRIGSSKEDLRKYPQRESKLFSILTFGEPTILTVESSRQDLSFKQLFGYYGSKGLVLNKDTFEINFSLKNNEGKYNLLAQLLSDNSMMPIRVAIFTGKTKASKLYAVREFAYQCLLYSLDDVLRYMDVINVFKRMKVIEL